ncbi:MAG: hypothetical protein Q8N51_10645 [Gammaproteobacteria bacterium]|nr:hypothetical protein [Gammaproteobacteria bacterium]
MKMCARSARVINSVALIAFLMGCGLSVVPTFAREELSAGQAGDPTDGNGITSTSGSSFESASNPSHSASQKQAVNRAFPEIVFVVNGVVYRLDIQVLLSRWKRT